MTKRQYNTNNHYEQHLAFTIFDQNRLHMKTASSLKSGLTDDS